jgi:hypothetical protein
MADFFGHSQFGGHQFSGAPQGQPSPAFHPGFETLAPGQVVYSMGAKKNKPGFTTEMTFPGGPVEYHRGLRRKRY